VQGATQAFAVMVCEHDRRRSEPTTIAVSELVSTLADAQAAVVRLNAARTGCGVFYFVRAVEVEERRLTVVG
jgi:hypothetical protein